MKKEIVKKKKAELEKSGPLGGKILEGKDYKTGKKNIK